MTNYWFACNNLGPRKRIFCTEVYNEGIGYKVTSSAEYSMGAAFQLTKIQLAKLGFFRKKNIFIQN